MLGHMSLNVISPPGAEINCEQMEFVQHSVKIYKDFIRPFLSQSKIYHHTPDLKKNEFAVIEIASSDSSQGAIGIFSLAGIKGNKVIKPKGIDVSENYIVYFDNDRCSFEISGRELRQKGIEIDISSAMASELVLYKVKN